MTEFSVHWRSINVRGRIERISGLRGLAYSWLEVRVQFDMPALNDAAEFVAAVLERGEFGAGRGVLE